MKTENTNGLIFNSKRIVGAVVVREANNHDLGVILKYGPKAGNNLARNYRFLPLGKKLTGVDLVGADYPQVKQKVIAAYAKTIEK